MRGWFCNSFDYGLDHVSWHVKLDGYIQVQDPTHVPLDTVCAFQKLPMVMPSIDILFSSLRKARRVSPTKEFSLHDSFIANASKREKNKGAKHLDALMKELTLPLKTYKEKFPNMRHLHPYERSLIELTLGYGNYEETLRAMPVIDLEMPTLCLVGAPNVGKSSLVRLLSTGKAEICTYPFTTRGILMGHVALSYQNFQVTDTPGMLRRPDECGTSPSDQVWDLSFGSGVIAHLPTDVLFVHDLTGECGTSPSDQFLIYQEIKERFISHLWIDVVSKCDLLEETHVLYITEDTEADPELLKYRKVGPDGAFRVSVKSEVGINEVVRED